MSNKSDFLFLKNNQTQDWFYHKYIDKLGNSAYDRGRWPTMKMALNLFLQRNGSIILETGCQREEEDWGAGGSTTIFVEFAQHYPNTKILTVDNSEEHLNRAKRFVTDHTYIQFYLSDSVSFLQNYNEQIDLLYLDSFDYPYGEILECYGGKEDINAAIAIVNNLTEEEIVLKHSHLFLEAQEHCLNEIKAAEHCLHNNSIVLIDDNSLAGGGKPRLARKWLQDNGWHVILDFQQSLWIKGN